jgi:hypothetical protein
VHATALLRRALAVLVRSGPEAAAWNVFFDSCSVRAKHGGDLTGPSPTDRGKFGTKYQVAVSTDGIPLAVVPSAANLHDTRLFPDQLRLAQVVCAAIGKLYAGAGYGSADDRWLCLRDGIQPHIRKNGRAAWNRARTSPLRRRAWLRLALDQQEIGPAPRQARADHPRTAHRGAIFIVASRLCAF